MNTKRSRAASLAGKTLDQETARHHRFCELSKSGILTKTTTKTTFTRGVHILPL